MSYLMARQLYYQYETREVLKGISFSANKGENIYILGPNGVGKSTLFRCIMGHLQLSEGEVQIQGKSITSYSPKQLAQKVAYIPQICTPSFNYTVLELATMGRTAHLSAFSSPRPNDYKLAWEVLERLGLEEKAECGICEISGGERQLAMIARALVQEASILLMDEPTSNLDYGNQIRVQSLMQQLAKEGLVVIQSSHNPQYAMLFADQVVALYDGQVIGEGPPKQVVTQELIKRLYGLDVDIHEGMILPRLA